MSNNNNINGLDEMTYNFTVSIIIFKPHMIPEFVRPIVFNDDVGFKRIIQKIINSSKDFQCYKHYPPKTAQLKKAIQDGVLFRGEYLAEVRYVQLVKDCAEITSEFNFTYR